MIITDMYQCLSWSTITVLRRTLTSAMRQMLGTQEHEMPELMTKYAYTALEHMSSCYKVFQSRKTFGGSGGVRAVHEHDWPQTHL